MLALSSHYTRVCVDRGGEHFGGWQKLYNGNGNLNSVTGPASPFATYTYNADGLRVHKALGSLGESGAAFTEYVGIGGQTLAETDGTNWTDYIHAAGQKIARIAPTYQRIHLTGTGCGANNEVDWNFYGVSIPIAANRTEANIDGTLYSRA